MLVAVFLIHTFLPTSFYVRVRYKGKELVVYIVNDVMIFSLAYVLRIVLFIITRQQEVSAGVILIGAASSACGMHSREVAANAKSRA